MTFLCNTMFAETCTIGENKRNWDKTDIISVKHTSVAREIRYIYIYIYIHTLVVLFQTIQSGLNLVDE